MWTESSVHFLSSRKVFREGEGTSLTGKEDTGENQRKEDGKEEDRIYPQKFSEYKAKVPELPGIHKEGINHSTMTASQRFYGSGTLITFVCMCLLLSSQ